MVVQPNLLADCSQCFGLCCVALPFAKTADFAHDKSGGEPCVNLDESFRCGIHTELRQRGYRGCTVFDCFGAGQKVSQNMFDGVSWRDAPELSKDMFAVFPVVRQLHELLWYLAEAIDLAGQPLLSNLEGMYAATENLTLGSAEAVLAVDVDAHRGEVNELLVEASEHARSASGLTGDQLARRNFRGADLIGAKMRGADLRGANMRGARLIAANLRDADLRMADVTGADFRDADLRGARLADCLFLTQSQINSAKGDTSTSLPSSITRPRHWTE